MRKDSTNIVPFYFESHEVRAVLLDGEPWWVGKDVCEALGYTNPSKAMGDHCKGVTKRYPLQTAGGMQELRILSEPDVLRLIVSSTLPEAQRFERWVFEEALPSIRKTGSYSARPVPPEKPTKVFAEFFRIGKLIGLDKNAAALAANNATVKVTQTDILALLGATHMESESQEHWFTPTDLGRELGMSARAFNLLLAEAGLQNSESGQWVPTDQAQGLCRIMDTGKHHHSGTMVTQLKWSKTVLDRLNRVAA